MECLINSSGGLPAVGDNRAGGTLNDLERVSVCLFSIACCCCCCCPLVPRKCNHLYLFLHLFQAVPRFIFTRNGSITSLHIGHDVSSHKEEIEDFINFFKLILPSEKRKKQLQLVQMDNTTVSRLATFAHTFLLRTLFQSYLEWWALYTIYD